MPDDVDGDREEVDLREVLEELIDLLEIDQPAVTPEGAVPPPP